MKHILQRLLCAWTLACFAPALHAQTAAVHSPMISYQAYILGPDGKPMNDAACPAHVELLSSDGASIWTDDLTVAVTDGIMNLILGAHAPLPAVTTMDRAVSIGVSIRGNPPIVSPLSSVPFALNVPDSSITAAKLGTDYVKSISVNGEKITSRGSDLNIVTSDGLRSTYVPTSNTLVLSGSTSGNDGTVQYVGGNPCGTNDAGGRDNNTVSGGCANTIFSNPGYIYGPALPFEFCVIGGGQSNTITNQVPAGSRNPDTEGTWWHTIGGGHRNAIIAEIVGSSHNEDTVMGASTIAGGEADTLSSPWGFIGGGYRNYIGFVKPMADSETGHKMRWNVITGGDSNTIIRWSQSSFIGGGSANHIGGTDTANQATFATIAGGDTNEVLTWGGTVGGGWHNSVTGTNGSVLGGDHNLAAADAATVGGGSTNASLSDRSAILGGENNTIDTNSPRSFIGGGRFNSIHSEVSVIAGGDTNTIGGTANHSAIGGGQENRIELLSPFSAIAGGLQNHIDSAAFAFIGGGLQNTIQGWASAIAGGETNQITDSAADHNFIGGGLGNVENNPSFGSIGGGRYNTLDFAAWSSAIAGGEWNKIKVAQAFIGAGRANLIEVGCYFSGIASGDSNFVQGTGGFIGAGKNNYNHGVNSSLVGGLNDTLQSGYSFMGGGEENYLAYGSEHSVLGGGHSNFLNVSEAGTMGGGFEDSLLSNYSFLGGGRQNKVDYGSPKAVIAGGDSNVVQDELGFIGGGCHNRVTDGIWGTIVGGCSNLIIDSLSFIGGGQDNFIQADLSTIAGGAQDSILDDFGFVGGGFLNLIEAARAVISGGDSNRIEDSRTPFSTIAGGSGNLIHLGFGSTIGGGQSNKIFSLDAGPAPRWSVIAGGESNTIDSTEHSTIGGGQSNYVGVNAEGATIPGGLNLMANSYNQAVVGRFNDPWGTSKSNKINRNDPLFTVGNGTAGARSDAFEVSNSGHSKVFETRGNETPAPGASADTVPIIASRYKDNTLLAWGDVVGNTLVRNFGVREIRTIFGNPGVYVVVLRIDNDRTAGPVTLSDVAVTATLKESILDPNAVTHGCGSITVTGLGAGYPGAPPANSGIFIIRTYNANCDLSPRDFEFHVFGR